MCGKIIKLCSEPLLSKDHTNDMRKGAQQHLRVLTHLARVVQNPCFDLYTGRFYFASVYLSMSHNLGDSQVSVYSQVHGGGTHLKTQGELGSDVGCIMVSNPVFLRQDLSNLLIRWWLCGIWHIRFKQDVSILYTHLVPAKEMTLLPPCLGFCSWMAHGSPSPQGAVSSRNPSEGPNGATASALVVRLGRLCPNPQALCPPHRVNPGPLVWSGSRRSVGLSSPPCLRTALRGVALAAPTVWHCPP